MGRPTIDGAAMTDPGVPPHPFKGRSDRWCEVCDRPDRNPIHDAILRDDGPAPPAAAPDDADLRAEVEQPTSFDDSLEARADWNGYAALENQRLFREAIAARDAALAGERAARERVASLETSIEMALEELEAEKWYEAEDWLRAALSPTPPDTAEQEPQR